MADSNPLDPDAPRAEPVSPDDEARFAFGVQQQDSQGRQRAQAAFDTMRMRRAFVAGVMAAKGSGGQQRALRESSLAQNLEGQPPTP